MVGGIFAILDDIAMLMDDTAAVTKISVKNTVPLLGDDLAVNAEKAAGYNASRELPVLWAITKGSFRNKLIILPIAFILSAVAPWLISPILVLGGLYLSFEGAEVIYHYLRSKFKKDVHHEDSGKKLTEEQKIKSAIVTDFILSIEIVVVALGSVIDQPFVMQLVVVSFIALLATVGVYGIVALLVRMDDIGYYIIEKAETNSLKEKFGKLLVTSLPKVIKVLSVVGTVAMLLVAGSLISHHVEFIHHFYNEHFSMIPLIAFDFILALVVGAILLTFITLFTPIVPDPSDK